MHAVFSEQGSLCAETASEALRTYTDMPDIGSNILHMCSMHT
jgi:hypothetical protein